MNKRQLDYAASRLLKGPEKDKSPPKSFSFSPKNPLKALVPSPPSRRNSQKDTKTVVPPATIMRKDSEPTPLPALTIVPGTPASRPKASSTTGKVSQDELGKRLWKLRLKPENKFCADCDASTPEMGSVTQGVFLCKECGEAHLKTVVSAVVKLVTDNWSEEQIEILATRGNRRVNDVYEKHESLTLPKPTHTATKKEREIYVKAKYSEKRFTKPEVLTRMQKQSAKKEAQAQKPLRLVDYFVVFGRGNPPPIRAKTVLPSATPSLDSSQTSSIPNSPSSLISSPSSSSLPSPTSVPSPPIVLSPLNTVYLPTILEKYPRQDHEDFELPEGLANFNFPKGVTICEKEEAPIFYTFVLTKVDGSKQYGICLQFYEKLNPLEVVRLTTELHDFHASHSVQEKFDIDKSVYEKELFSPKSLCLISHWQFSSLFEDFLKMLYRISNSAPPLPLERYLANFVHEVPVPPLGKIRVQYTLADKVLFIQRPPPNKLPLSDVKFDATFRALSLQNILTLFIAFALERKVLLCSAYWSLLTDVAETMCALLWPFSWQGVYMPLLPMKMTDFVYAPVPFVAGVHASYLNAIDLPDDVIFVNIDENKVTGIDQLPSFPEKVKKKLISSLNSCANIFNPQLITKADLAFPNGENLIPVSGFATEGGVSIKGTLKPPEQKGGKRGSVLKIKKEGSGKSSSSQTKVNIDVDEVRDAFLRIWTRVFVKYRSFLITVSTELGNDGRPRELFDKPKFIEDTEEDMRPFVTEMLQAQAFGTFIDSRWTKDGKCQPTDSEEIKLFDELLIAKQNRSKLQLSKKTPFLEDKSLAVSETFVAPPPSTIDLKHARYEYNSFPKLQDNLFGKIRYVKPLIEDHKKFKQQKKHNVRDSTLTVAQAGRKDWSETMQSVITIQRNYRGYLARKKYKSMRREKAVRNLQAYAKAHLAFRKRMHDMNKIRWLQELYRHRSQLRQDRNNFLRARKAAQVLQAVIRCHLERQAAQKATNAIRCLQAVITGALAAQRAKQAKKGLSWMKKRLLIYAARKTFLRQKRGVIKTQARFRGLRVRRVANRQLHSEILKAKKQLIDLWTEHSSLLLYRSKFWLCFEEKSYLNLALLHEEIKRLKGSKTNGEKNRLKLEGEKKALYVKLKKEIPDDTKSQIYTQFGIPVRSKKRKEHLINAIWNFKSTDFKDEKVEVKDNKHGKDKKEKMTESMTTFEATAHRHAQGFNLIIQQGLSDTDYVADLADKFQLKRDRRIKENLLSVVSPTLLNLGKQQKTTDKLKASVSRGCEVIKLLQREVRSESKQKAQLELELQQAKLLLTGASFHSSSSSSSSSSRNTTKNGPSASISSRSTSNSMTTTNNSRSSSNSIGVRASNSNTSNRQSSYRREERKDKA